PPAVSDVVSTGGTGPPGAPLDGGSPGVVTGPAGAVASWPLVAGAASGEPGMPGAPPVWAPDGPAGAPSPPPAPPPAPPGPRPAPTCAASPPAGTIAFDIGPSPRGRAGGARAAAGGAPAPSRRAWGSGRAASTRAASRWVASSCAAPGPAASRRTPSDCAR